MGPALSRHPGIRRSKSGMLAPEKPASPCTGIPHWGDGCAVSPDGTWIVSASWDKTLKVWDAGTGEARLTLHGHTDAVWGCAVSPDGAFIVSASYDKRSKSGMRAAEKPASPCTGIPMG